MSLVCSLQQAFRDADPEDAGTIGRSRLETLLCSLDPELTENELRLLLSGAGGAPNPCAGGMVEYDVFLETLAKSSTIAEVPAWLVQFGEAESTVEVDASQLEAFSISLASADPRTLQACQDFAVEHHCAHRLLSLAVGAKCIDTRRRLLDVLLFFVSGSEQGSVAATTDTLFLPCMRAALREKDDPRLCMSALLVLHACVASGKNGVSEMLCPALGFVAAFLNAGTDSALIEIAIDVLGFYALYCPSSVVQCLGWQLLSGMVAEDASRPAWLPNTAWHVLSCGLLAAAVLQEAGADDQHCEAMRRLMITRLSEGRCVAYLISAITATTVREDWPLGSGAFHLGWRLAISVGVLARHGYAKRLANSVRPLAAVVTDSPDSSMQREALFALRLLSEEDSACLEAMLPLTAFRAYLRDEARRDSRGTGAEIHAYLVNADRMLAGAREAQDAAASSCRYGPSVTDLLKIFLHFRPLDGMLGPPQLLEALRLVPIGPPAAVKRLLPSLEMPRKMNFQDFARCVYGFPQKRDVQGLWLSLMDKAAGILATTAPEKSGRALPELAELLTVFERVLRASTMPSAEQVFYEILAFLELENNDCLSADDWTSFVEAQPGNTPSEATKALSFPSFVAWVLKLWPHL